MMHRNRIFEILAITALCMHFMAQLSPLWATENGAFEVQICSGDSWETISIDENGNEVPAKPKLRSHPCAFCAASCAASDTPNTTTYPLSHKLNYVKYNHKKTEVQTSLKPNRAHQTRAPPALS